MAAAAQQKIATPEALLVSVHSYLNHRNLKTARKENAVIKVGQNPFLYVGQVHNAVTISCQTWSFATLNISLNSMKQVCLVLSDDAR
jgi:hypothetical protein